MSDESAEAREVDAYYARGLEHDRLAGGPGALEFARTSALLERYLPAPPAVVADVRAGPCFSKHSPRSKPSRRCSA